jgi:hypothetical protein
MKRFFLAACGVLLFGMVGSAAPVSFATSGSLLCNGASGCSGGGTSISFTSGSAVLTIQYNSNSESNLQSQFPGATTNFGSLLLTCSGCAGQTESFALVGATLAISINQTLPAFGTQPVFGTAQFLGTLTVTNGTFGGVATVDFPTLSATFGSAPPVTYVLQEPQSSLPGQLPDGYALSIGNSTSLQGIVISNDPVDIPEPSTMALIGLGLASLGLMRRRS